ncbi:MAG: hypothetical protein HWE30_11950 [Methylocystaceae bacterium]|nr:hypothetical protein [Methylocystaceae bacterium]
MLRPGITRERLAGLCALGVLLFSPSLIGIFDRGGEVTFFGVPVLVVYIFGVWTALIIVAAVLIIRRQRNIQDHIELEED